MFYIGSFDVDVYVSGYATSRRPPEFSTRSQRAFIRLAKGFAALPKIQVPPPNPNGSSDPLLDDNLLASLKLPPRPWEISDDYEVGVLEERFQHVEVGNPDCTGDDVSFESETSVGSIGSSQLPSQRSISSALSNAPASLSSDIHRLHANLESRLQPFWASALSSRTIRVHVFACPAGTSHPNTTTSLEDERKSFDYGPLLTKDIPTGSDGSFSAKFTIAWKDICTHPLALHIAFGDPTQEYDLLIVAELLPPPVTLPGQVLPPPSQPSAQSTLHISITQSPVRVISDIDDTVKVSSVSSGARAVFHNVFVKDLQDIIIPGMGEWYDEMWKRGVRFHYVSNSPFELLPVITQFFQVSRLPPGSVKLKSYAGRSLFNGLLSAPATRKRANAVDTLDSFPNSKFILIGDSGEQDLELYASIAQERPNQIIAIFIRDVATYTDGISCIYNPTGANNVLTDSPPLTPRFDASPSNVSIPKATTPPPHALPKRTKSDLIPKARPSRQLNMQPFPTDSMTLTGLPVSTDPGSYLPSPGSSVDSASSISSSISLPIRAGRRLTGQASMLSESEKKRIDLQLRVNRARALIPRQVVLRIFKEPRECVEARELLDALHVGIMDAKKS
ncbi:hypothetical protein SERLA73DRAFT_61437 [Serpula lacrymans var. lacrymans S7.3]|uniref:Phosphatidate phosphatase APP1 catalytic domain-containing protein n=1 Tax=Serpula lacrymans var. lacrymans (strain S7.3) TaxID=936435 RepID=F8Q959_SERL3|nr:hypothetical protein SERLA73DRAFT_61437 [Serpula lacrymans var. lacrymans S7.3]